MGCTTKLCLLIYSVNKYFPQFNNIICDFKCNQSKRKQTKCKAKHFVEKMTVIADISSSAYNALLNLQTNSIFKWVNT